MFFKYKFMLMIDFVFISNLKIDILINVLINQYYCFICYKNTCGLPSYCISLYNFEGIFSSFDFLFPKLKCYVAMETWNVF